MFIIQSKQQVIGLIKSNRKIIIMEEKSPMQLSQTMSSWKLKQEVLKNQRNFRQLENRLIILEMERQSKIKSIQKKLQNHKKVMEVRLDRFKLKESIEKCQKSIDQQANSNSRVFKQVRAHRTINIRSKSNQIRQINNRLFKQIKMQREENQKLIRQQSQKQLQLKAEKRKRVRLIQIQSKENISKFWRSRLNQFKQIKEYQMARQLSMEEKKMQWLINLQRSEQELLKQLKKTEQMQSQVVSMMAEQKSMISAAVGNKV